jgi:chromate transporter
MPSDPPDQTPPLVRPGSAWELFRAFTLLAVQGFGGVMAVTQRELVERKRWLTPGGFLEDWAVAQILPGPNVVNLAVMLGDRYLGARGALAAIAGLLAVPFVLIVALAIGFESIRHLPQVDGALRGMGVVVAALIVSTALKLAPALRSHPGGLVFCLLIGASTLASVIVLKWPLPWTLLSVGGVSCLWTWHRLRRADHSRS